MEQKSELVRRADVDALIDQIAGTVLTHLSSLLRVCAEDLATWRSIERVVFEGAHRNRSGLPREGRQERRAVG
jgi:hypothetical protein